MWLFSVWHKLIIIDDLSDRALLLAKRHRTPPRQHKSRFINQSSADNSCFYGCALDYVFHATVKPQCFLYWFSCLVPSRPDTTGGRADALGTKRKHQKKLEYWRYWGWMRQSCLCLGWDECLIKLSYPSQVWQYVNEGAAAVGGSVGCHLVGKEPPQGTCIPLPGHVQEGWGGSVCELWWVPERSQRPVLVVCVPLTELLKSK